MLTSVKSDKILVYNYLNGCNQSFEKLLTRHKNRVFGFIMSKIKNKELADDLFQDTFVKVVNSLQKGKYNEEGKFLPWVMRIAHNLIIDHFRREKKNKKISNSSDFDIFDFISNGERTQDEDMIRKRVYKDLNDLVEFLPSNQKNVLKMRYYEDLSFKKISQKTDVSINTALGRMRYAILNLRNLSKQKNIDLYIK
tara:strand:+ start:5150 stop:5737 length:588 start_codon:yes stop_codon:yes gene_type:complete